MYDIDAEDMSLIVAGGVGFVALMEGESHALDHAIEIINRRGGVGRLLEALETASQQDMRRAG